MHETFEHTADLGLRIRAADLDMLFVEAAQALFETIVLDLASVRPLKKMWNICCWESSRRMCATTA